jgi:hypothetical protein
MMVGRLCRIDRNGRGEGSRIGTRECFRRGAVSRNGEFGGVQWSGLGYHAALKERKMSTLSTMLLSPDLECMSAADVNITEG